MDHGLLQPVTSFCTFSQLKLVFTLFFFLMVVGEIIKRRTFCGHFFFFNGCGGNNQKKNILWPMKIIWNSSFPAHTWNFIGTQRVHCLHIVCGCFHITNAELNGMGSCYLWPLCSVKSPGILNQQYWATAPREIQGEVPASLWPHFC